MNPQRTHPPTQDPSHASRVKDMETEPLARLNEQIKTSAQAALGLQRDDGSMPPGHNGPYHDPETPVRNTAHWLQVFLFAYEETGKAQFKQAAHAAADYLTSQEARPGGYTFHCRDTPKKDRVNGLVGQAWVIEALAPASKTLERPGLYQLAEETYRLHPWDENVFAWGRRETDGSTPGFDETFNHQLWFAAAAAQLEQTPDAIDHAHRFTETLPDRIRLYPSGVIRHVNHGFLARGRIARTIASARDLAVESKNRQAIHRKSVGYHGFNLHALALLAKRFPQAAFWNDPRMNRLFLSVETPEFERTLESAPYGLAYNPSGFEIAFALQRFKSHETNRLHYWLERQLHHGWDAERGLLTRNSSDEMTSAARIYEALRLLEP